LVIVAERDANQQTQVPESPMNHGKKNRAAFHLRDAREQHAASREANNRPPSRDPRVQGGRMAQPRNSLPRSDQLDDTLRDAMLGAVPRLRAFAISLCGNVDKADDLVQETLLRALSHIDQFEPGTNMPAWLFTILRNLFRSDYRKRRREVEDDDGSYAETLKSQPEQSGRLEFEELPGALAKLPADQREALILVGASGLSYEEAAQICGCPIGTIKSRVNRARGRLAELLSIESVDDLGPDQATRAVLMNEC
jgi:RNA polymerase sigma-70 factor, ECF subfamily